MSTRAILGLLLLACALSRGVWAGESPAIAPGPGGVPEYVIPSPPGGGVRVRGVLEGPWLRAEIADLEEAPLDGRPGATAAWRPARLPDLIPGERAGLGTPTVVYRARLRVSRDCAGCGAVMCFDGTTGAVGVWIDGVPVAEHVGFGTPWRADVTGRLVAGGEHEVVIAVRSVPGRPAESWGVTGRVAVDVTGVCYADSAHVETDPVSGVVVATVRLVNADVRAKSVTVACEVVDEKLGTTSARLSAAEATIPAGGEASVTVRGEIPDARLWWPEPNADLYLLRTVVSEDETPVDIHHTAFGVCTVSVDGASIRLNGVRRNFWRWRAGPDARSGDEFALAHRADNDRLADVSVSSWPFPVRSCDEVLTFCDRNGIAVNLDLAAGRFVGEGAQRAATAHVIEAARTLGRHPCVVMFELGDVDGVADAAVAAMADALRRVGAGRPCWARGVSAPPADLDARPANESGERGAPVVSCASILPGGAVAIAGDGSGAYPWTRAGVEASWSRRWCERARWRGDACLLLERPSLRTRDELVAFADVAVVTRWSERRLTSGATAELPVRVLNDTFDPGAVDFAWEFRVAGGFVAGGNERLDIAPGNGVSRDLEIRAPVVTERVDGVLSVSASQAGVHVFVDERVVPVLPTVDAIEPGAPLLLLDRPGRVSAFLDARTVGYEPLDRLRDARGRPGTLLIGNDSLTDVERTGYELMAFAARGGTVIVLEHDRPVGGAALPVRVDRRENGGERGFPQQVASPVLSGLDRTDLSEWRGARRTYRAPYAKPVSGAWSLVECGRRLEESALLEIPCGAGRIVCCQLSVGSCLDTEIAAATVLRNMLVHYGASRRDAGAVSVFGFDEPVADPAGALGLDSRPAASAAAALDPFRYRVAVIRGAPEVLDTLAATPGRLDAFRDSGRWLMVWGVASDSRASLESLLRTTIQMRTYQNEPVVVRRSAHAFADGLASADLAAAHDAEGHGPTVSVLDGWDIAPFCERRIVPGEEEGDVVLVFDVPRAVRLGAVEVRNPTGRWPMDEAHIVVDDEDDASSVLPAPGGGFRLRCELDPPLDAARKVSIVLRGARRRDVRDVEVSLLRASLPDGVTPLDSVGGLTVFRAGSGGVVVNQLPLDAPLRQGARRALSTLLVHMGARWRTERPIVPVANIAFHPVDITRWCAGDADADAGAWRTRLLRGDRGELREIIRAGSDVQHDIARVAGGPAAPCILLAGGATDAALGIEIGRRADAVFFAHAAQVGSGSGDADACALRYRVHYVDGASREVRVVLGEHIGDWRTRGGAYVDGARAVRIDRAGSSGGVVYSMIWRNPRPRVVLRSIDVAGCDGASAAVVAITTGSIRD